MSHQESIPVLTTVHPPVPPPSLADRADISDAPTHYTDFRHPAYPLGEELLLRLPAFDHPDGGLTHAVALDCLTIITANAVGGYLAKTRDGPPIDVTRYAVLTEKEYYFIVPRPAGYGENGDSTNGITLHADLHIEFDACDFVLMQKSEYEYTIHCLRATPDVLPAHHNYQTRPFTTVGPEFICALLAYATGIRLPRNCSQFLKRVIRLNADSGTKTKIVDIVQETPSRSQNLSLRKRS